MQVLVYLLFRFNERLTAPVSFNVCVAREHCSTLTMRQNVDFFSINFEHKKETPGLFFMILSNRKCNKLSRALQILPLYSEFCKIL